MKENKLDELFNYAANVMGCYDSEYKESEWQKVERRMVSQIRARITEATSASTGQIGFIVLGFIKEADSAIGNASKILDDMPKVIQEQESTADHLRQYHRFRAELFNTFYYLTRAGEAYAARTQPQSTNGEIIMNEDESLISMAHTLDTLRRSKDVNRQEYFDEYQAALCAHEETCFYKPAMLKLYVAFEHYPGGSDDKMPANFKLADGSSVSVDEIQRVTEINGFPATANKIGINPQFGAFSFSFIIHDEDEIHKELIKPGNVGDNLCLILVADDGKVFIKNTTTIGIKMRTDVENSMVFFTIDTLMSPEGRVIEK